MRERERGRGGRERVVVVRGERGGRYDNLLTHTDTHTDTHTQTHTHTHTETHTHTHTHTQHLPLRALGQ